MYAFVWLGFLWVLSVGWAFLGLFFINTSLYASIAWEPLALESCFPQRSLQQPLALAVGTALRGPGLLLALIHRGSLFPCQLCVHWSIASEQGLS